MSYCVPIGTEKKIISLFDDMNIKYRKYTYQLLDFDEAANLCFNEQAYPLFGDLNVYIRYENAFRFMPVMKNRLMLEYKARYECDPSFHFQWGDGSIADEEDIFVFTGLYAISLFGNNLFMIDHDKYGIESFEDFVFYSGAIASNISLGEESGSSDLPVVCNMKDVGIVKSPYGDRLSIKKIKDC